MRNKSRSARLLSFCLAILLALAPSMVFADVKTAQDYYRQASEAYQAGNLEKAADLLERAYAEDPNLVYQYNRILALRGLGRFEEALRVLEIYENPMLDDEGKRFTDVPEIKADLQTKIAEAKANDGKEGDGKEGDGKEGDGKEGDGKVGDGKEGDGKEGDGKDGDGKGKDKEPEEVPWLGYTLLGAGVLSIGLGSLFASGVLVSEELDRASCGSTAIKSAAPADLNAALRACGYSSPFATAGPQVEYRELTDAYKSDVEAVDSQKVLAGVFLGTGAALLIVGGVVWLVSGGEESKGSASVDSPTLEFAPYVSHDGFGGVLRAEF